MATIILEDNQSLSNKNFTIPKKLIQQLKTTADIVDNTYSDKGDESYKKSLGYKRNQKLTNSDYNTRKNEGENNVISYGELKRWKHDLDHMAKSKKNLAYVLNGGEEANVFVNNTLNQARNAVAPVNKVKKSDNISKSKLKPSLTNTKTANIDKLSTNQVKIHESTILSENREGKNINLARRVLVNNFNYSPQDAQTVVDEIRRKIPNSRVAQCKFLSGIARMYAEDELTDNSIVNKLNKTLLYISSNAHVDEYDYNLNDLSSQELVNRFATNIENDLNSDKEKLSSETFDTESDYNIVRINSFQEAKKYSDYTTWCVTQDADAYNNYTDNGERVFYFCLKNGFENVEEIKGNNTPLDEYGLSMIAVSVNLDGSLYTCTCRWNHDNGGNDNVMDTNKLSKVIGRNFYETFKPLTEEELKELEYKKYSFFHEANKKFEVSFNDGYKFLRNNYHCSMERLDPTIFYSVEYTDPESGISMATLLDTQEEKRLLTDKILVNSIYGYIPWKYVICTDANFDASLFNTSSLSFIKDPIENSELFNFARLAYKYNQCPIMEITPISMDYYLYYDCNKEKFLSVNDNYKFDFVHFKRLNVDSNGDFGNQPVIYLQQNGEDVAYDVTKHEFVNDEALLYL